MSSFLNKAEYNSTFLRKVEEEYPYDFWDWKCTILFYVSIHCLKGLAEVDGQNLGNSHKEIWKNIREEKVFKLPDHVRKTYQNLFQLSISSRYDGFTTSDNFNRIQEINYSDAKRYLSVLKAHVEAQCTYKKVVHSFFSS